MPTFQAQIKLFRTERWVSGLNQRFAKPSYGVNLYREFKSLPLRNFSMIAFPVLVPIRGDFLFTQ